RPDAVPRHDDEETEIYRMPCRRQDPDFGGESGMDDGADPVQAQQVLEGGADESIGSHLCDHRFARLRGDLVDGLPSVGAVMAVLEAPALLGVARDRPALA